MLQPCPKPCDFSLGVCKLPKYSCLTAERKNKTKQPVRLLCFSPFPHDSVTSALRLPGVTPPGRPLAGQHQQQEQRQVPEAAEEQLPGALPVRVPVEPEAEVGNVQVDGEGDDREGPRGDIQGRGRGGERDQSQAVAQGDTAAQRRVGDRHHAVAAPGVVFAEAPAQGVEMGKLPGVEDSSQKNCSCRGLRESGEQDTLSAEVDRAIVPLTGSCRPARGSLGPPAHLRCPLLREGGGDGQGAEPLQIPRPHRGGWRPGTRASGFLQRGAPVAPAHAPPPAVPTPPQQRSHSPRALSQ